MISAIQTVSSVSMASQVVRLAAVLQAANPPNTGLVLPSTTVSLDTTTATPVIYNATGVFDTEYSSGSTSTNQSLAIQATGAAADAATSAQATAALTASSIAENSAVLDEALADALAKANQLASTQAGAAATANATSAASAQATAALTASSIAENSAVLDEALADALAKANQLASTQAGAAATANATSAASAQATAALTASSIAENSAVLDEALADALAKRLLNNATATAAGLASTAANLLQTNREAASAENGIEPSRNEVAKTDASAALPSVPSSLPSMTENYIGSTSTTPTTTPNIVAAVNTTMNTPSSTPEVLNLPAGSLPIDSAVQALSTVAQNPAYANLVAVNYVGMANSSAQSPLMLAASKPLEEIKPVIAISAIAAPTQLGAQSGRDGNPALGYRQRNALSNGQVRPSLTPS